MTFKDDTLLIGAGVAVLLLGAWYLSNHATDIVKAVPQAVADTAAAAVIGTGKVLGIPETNTDQCSQDLAAGRTWDASFSCPAGTFIRSIFD